MYYGSHGIHDIGTNLVADGIVMALTIFLIDHLFQVQRRRESLARTRIVHRALCSIHANAFSLWGILLFIALRLDESLGKGEQCFDDAFASLIGSDAFSKDKLDALRDVGCILERHKFKEIIARDVEARTKRLTEEIRQTQSVHESVLRPELYSILDELRRSPLVCFCSYLSRCDLHTLGGNILSTPAQDRKLIKDLFGNHHVRDDPRSLEVLPHGDDHEIQEVFRLLADEIDKLADQILTQRAHYVPRTLSKASLLLQWHSYLSRLERASDREA